MTSANEALERAFDINDAVDAARILSELTEAERKRLRARIRQRVSEWYDIFGKQSALAVAALGTAGGARQAAQALDHVSVHGAEEIAAGLLRFIRPAWLPEFPAAILIERNQWRGHWVLVRALVRHRAIPKPDLPAYTTFMPPALRWVTSQTGATIDELLRGDPDLLHDEVFRLFSVEGASKALYWADAWFDNPRFQNVANPRSAEPHPELTWRATLARLCNEGLIERDRLIDSCLEAFSRDFPTTQLTWYVGMHDELALSNDEMAARAETYLRILSGNASAGIGLAQRVVGMLLTEKRVSPDRLIEASVAALHRREKGLAVTQLKLVERSARERPTLTDTALDVVAVALTHDRTDVQKAALGVIRRLQPDGVLPLSRLQEHVESLAVVLHDDAREVGLKTSHAALIGGSINLSELGRRIELTPVDDRRAMGLDVALVDVEQGRVPAPLALAAGAGRTLPAPITDPEDVVAQLIVLIESADDPIAVERAFAGAVRTAGLPPERRAQIAGPLAERAKQQMMTWTGPFIGADLRALVAAVAYSWSTGRRVQERLRATVAYRDFMLQRTSVTDDGRPVTPSGIVALRAAECMRLVSSGRACDLLAEPTSERGAVDEEALIDRVSRCFTGLWNRAQPAKYDVELAALRLNPTCGDEFFARLKKLNRGVAAAIRDAMDDARETPQLEPCIGSPVQAQRWQPQRGPVVLAATNSPRSGAGMTWSVLTNLSDPLASYVRLSAEGEFTTDYEWIVPTWALLAPWQPEIIAAHLLRPLSRGLRTGRSGARAAVTCLTHPDHPLGPIGHLALLTGLCGAEADTRAAAADVLAHAAADGRLSPGLGAEAISTLVANNAFKPNRFSESLKHLASVPAAGLRLAETLALAAPALLRHRPTGAHLVLGLAAELATVYGVEGRSADVDEAIRRGGSSQLVQEARRLHGAVSRPTDARRAAATEMLVARLARLEP